MLCDHVASLTQMITIRIYIEIVFTYREYSLAMPRVLL